MFLRQRVWAPGVPFTTRSLSAVNSFRNSLHRMVFTGHPFLLEVRHDTLAAKGAHPLPVYYWRTEVRINRKEPLKLGSAGTPPRGGSSYVIGLIGSVSICACDPWRPVTYTPHTWSIFHVYESLSTDKISSESAPASTFVLSCSHTNKTDESVVSHDPWRGVEYGVGVLNPWR